MFLGRPKINHPGVRYCCGSPTRFYQTMSTLVRVQGLSHRDTREKVKRFPIIVETYIIDMFLLDISDDFVQFSIKKKIK